MRNFHKLYDKDMVRSVFDNIRNLIVCALIIAAGLYEHGNSSGLVGWLAVTNVAGWLLVAIGVVLTIANLVVGLAQLATLAWPKLSMTMLLCLYVLASVRLVVVMAAFRAG
ncbi:hypothetical protein [Variovorax saccharolyticus]|uniref:hypothetical protein n=1 Tax=Variovorax saccharolyticus TaxID=3053516 RepID=UPI0025778D3A|nr:MULTISPECIES: hypothetical protein [unclassified Variovorax]MDM0022460.1 hypothetical protein [Variovorax sp. J22R187]MDM0028224.1 hypothetical protein [Variovorax sp. J31P216]